VVDLGTLTMKPIRVGAFPTRFQCGELAMTLDFLGERARLTVGQTEYEMRPTRTADGARFEAVNDPATWFWNRGRGGTLSLAGREYPECRQVDTTPSSLPGDEGGVEDLDGGGIIDRSRATLAFGTDGQVAGRGSCNTYTARHEANGDAIRIADVASTARACAPSLMDQEARFYAALRDARRFQIRADGALVLHTDDRRSILARRATPR
jgi:heat shock protein HslJ